MNARVKFNFNVISLLLANVSAIAHAASRRKRENLFISADVESKTLQTAELNVETTVNEVSKLLIPSSGFCGKHFGSIKPKGACKAV